MDRDAVWRFTKVGAAFPTNIYPLSPSLLWDSDSANGAVVLPQVRIPGAAGTGPVRAVPKQGWRAQADGQRGLGSRCLRPLHPRGPLWQCGHHGADHPSLGAAGAVQ